MGTAEKASLRKQQFDRYKPVKTDIIPIHLTDSQYPPSLLALWVARWIAFHSEMC